MIYNILLTGANRGLGLALTKLLLLDGHRVYTINRHRSEGLSRLHREYPNHLHMYTGDLSSEVSIKKALEGILEAGYLDMVINNAAVHLDQNPNRIEKVDFSVNEQTFRVNSIAPLMILKYALPLIRKGRKKLIVNVSSEAGSIQNAWRKSEYAYCMSKAALNMASQILQNDLKDEGIKVLALHPGWFSSDMGGADAPITPIAAAKDMVKLILQPIDLNGPVYISSDGKKMDW